MVDGAQIDDLYLFLTNESLVITFLSLAFTIYASSYENPQNELINYKTLAYYVNSIVEILNLEVSVVSWIVIIPLFFQREGAWTDALGIYRSIMSMVVHTCPLIYTTVNIFFLSDVSI